MKKSVIFLFLFINTSITIGQNLVPNPSFEEYSQCPFDVGGFGQLYFAYPWHNPSYSSPDFFNACDTLQHMSVPYNYFGNENAHTGFGYSGIYCYYVWGFSREYIQVQLKDSLLMNTRYCVEFYVSLAEKSTYGVNNLGAYLSINSINSNSDTTIGLSPQIINNDMNPLTNKTGWKKISGSFVANGGEQYITIGNFNNNPASDTVFVDSTGWNGGISYYYIDDVSVYQCDASVYIAEAGKNVIICKGDSVQIGSAPKPEYYYSWHPSTGLNDTSVANPLTSPLMTTTYYLKQKDFKFDETIDSVTITVISCEDTIRNSLTIPNAFTPNSDGKNDVFKVQGLNVKSMYGKIFNRWGQKLYEWNDINTGWDGKYNGKDVLQGVYFYVVSATFGDGKIEEKHGSVEVIR